MDLPVGSAPDGRGFVNLEANLLLASIIFLCTALVAALILGFRGDAFAAGFVEALLSGWRAISLFMGLIGLALLYGPSVLEALAKPFQRAPPGKREEGSEE